MNWLKLRFPRWSRLTWCLIASVPVTLCAAVVYDLGHDSSIGEFVLGAFYCVAVILKSVIDNRVPQRVWKWAFAKRVNPFDIRWLRWVVTLLALGIVGAAFAFRVASWLLLPSIAAFGLAMSVYFGHLLFFRMQCGLLELMAVTTFFGLIDGLMLSTPGAFWLGLYFSPMVLAWVLYGTASGLIRARVLGTVNVRVRMLYILAAWWGSASIALMGVGGAVIGFSQTKLWGLTEYAIWGWPLAIFGLLGFALDLWLNAKTKRRAKFILKAEPPADGNPALNPGASDATPNPPRDANAAPAGGVAIHV